MPGSGGAVTRLLSELREGNQETVNQRVPLVYGERRRMAGACMQRERRGHPLQATALVNEAYIRMVAGEPAQWQNRAHFFAIAAHTMRQVLVEYSRRRHADKRGGIEGRKVDIDAELFIAEDKLEDVIAIDDPRQSRLIELRFSGLNLEEEAEVMGVSPTTLKREWRLAKAWLGPELSTAESG